MKKASFHQILHGYKYTVKIKVLFVSAYHFCIYFFLGVGDGPLVAGLVFKPYLYVCLSVYLLFFYVSHSC